MGLRKYFKKYIEKHSAFFKGMGSLSLFPVNDSKPFWMNNNLTPEEQDALAIKSDWEAVGNDLREVTRKYGNSLTNKLNQ